MASAKDGRLKLGVSACLLGKRVRHDGGHKRDAWLVETLGQYADWVPVCPEVEVGLPTPRPAIRLVNEGGERPALRVRTTGEDLTARMEAFSRRRVAALAGLGLHGYVLKKDSPSCGLEREKVWPPDDGRPRAPEKKGRGAFARVLAEALPLLPLEDEGRLHDPGIRENFIERIFAYRRWQDFLATGPGPGELGAFHAATKLSLMAHSPERYRVLGRLVAEPARGQRARREALESYGQGLMEALAIRATPRKHANVLQHLAGYLKRALDAEDRAEVAAVIERYRLGQVPLVVPLTLLGHHFRRHPHPWISGQTYLAPYPEELMLRNHV